jgi:hypothetical protein
MGRGEDGDDRGEDEDEDDIGDIEAIEMEEDLVEQIEYAICRMYEMHGETFLPLLEEVRIINVQGLLFGVQGLGFDFCRCSRGWEQPTSRV